MALVAPERLDTPQPFDTPTSAMQLSVLRLPALLVLLDRHGQPVPVGVPGQLYLGGDGLARGYWNRDELTVEEASSSSSSAAHGSHAPAAAFARTCSGLVAPAMTLATVGRARSHEIASSSNV